MENQSDQHVSNNSSKVFIAAAVVVLILLGVMAYRAGSKKQPAIEMTKTTQPSTLPTSEPTITSSVSAPVLAGYKNGSFTATGDYISPGGDEQLDVTVTLDKGVVTDSQVVSKATRPMSKRFQGIFIANYKQYVVGKSLDSIKLDKVSGSSLAPKGFNDAIEKIKSEAKA